jgi:hypothetical protein
MPHVTYKGPSSRSDLTNVYSLRGEDGAMHTLRVDNATEVPDDVAALLLGSDSPKGHKFAESSDEEKRAAGVPVDTAAAEEKTGAGTTRAAART